MNQADRVSFSLQIVSAPLNIANVQSAQAQLSKVVEQSQALDTAHANLISPITLLINGYQNELKYIDGNIRTEIAEQNIVDAANKKLENYFFPNSPSVSVPSLSALGNVWAQMVPYALNFAIGKNYSESHSTIVSEVAQINTVLPLLISDLGGLLDDAIDDLILIVTNEKNAILTSDTNTTNATQNSTAVTNANAALTQLNGWVSHSVSNNTLHTYLQSTRLPFLTTRASQINAILGSISQNVTNGNISSSSGLYGQRYGVISLRLHMLTGSLTALNGLSIASNAQSTTVSSLQNSVTTYSSMVPTSILSSPASGTAIIFASDTSFLSEGDTVYLVSDTQPEIQRAIKSINGTAVTLNDIVPAKYRPSDNARIYKDLT